MDWNLYIDENGLLIMSSYEVIGVCDIGEEDLEFYGIRIIQ